MGEQTFRDKVAVVTGASRGLGRGCAVAFASSGAEVVAIARNRSELDVLVEECRGLGGGIRAHVADVTDPEAVHQLFESLDRCDILVNNAGSNRPQPFLEVDLTTLDSLISLNIRSMFVVAQAAARIMVRKKTGCIVNMSSQMGHIGAPNRTVYCTTKHAVEGLTKAMAVELAPSGVRVNAVAPTFVETPMTHGFLSDPAFKKKWLEQIPLGRFGTVAEVVSAVVYLASPAAGMITGTSLRVDGGYTAQ